MINLIPPSAKKSLVKEYWLRVVAVWSFTWAAAIVLGIFLILPAYVLLTLQVKAFSSSAANANATIADFEMVSNDLNKANLQAKAVLEGLRYTTFSEYLRLFKSYEGGGVTLSGVGLERNPEGVAPVRIAGVATDRQALASFRDRLLADPSVERVDLPISNLAKDRDIQFTLTVTLKKSTS